MCKNKVICNGIFAITMVIHTKISLHADPKEVKRQGNREWYAKIKTNHSDLANPNKYIDPTGKSTKNIVYRDVLEG